MQTPLNLMIVFSGMTINHQWSARVRGSDHIQTSRTHHQTFETDKTSYERRNHVKFKGDYLRKLSLGTTVARWRTSGDTAEA